MECTIPNITIQGTVIAFPNSGSSPDWSPAVIQFAEAVSNALSTSTGPADVAQQVLTLDSYNPGTNVLIPNLTFSTALVRAAYIKYSVIRSTSSMTVAEAGNIMMVYNPSLGSGLKWEMDRNYVQDASITFSVSDTGQVQFSTGTLSGTGHTGTLTYSAQALLQT